MIESNAKADLLRYLQAARDALLWKLDGLSEYDIRRPLTSTGTNPLGLVKHVAGVELGYFGDTFGRPFFEEPPLWFTAGAEPNADMSLKPSTGVQLIQDERVSPGQRPRAASPPAVGQVNGRVEHPVALDQHRVAGRQRRRRGQLPAVLPIRVGIYASEPCDVRASAGLVTRL
jgi:hypothetical protein